VDKVPVDFTTTNLSANPKKVSAIQSLSFREWTDFGLLDVVADIGPHERLTRHAGIVANVHGGYH